MRRALVTTALLAAAAPACGEGLPPEERIASVRPLAVRVEVDEPAPPADVGTMAEAMPRSTAHLRPFIVDPYGPLTTDRIAQELEPVWLACNLQPVQGLLGCLQEAVPLQPSAVPACPPPDLGGFDPSTGMLPTTPSPCRIETDDPATPAYTIPLDGGYLVGGDIEVTMVAHTTATITTAACLEQLLLDRDPDPGCLYVTQRLAVGPDAKLIELAQQFGVPADALPPLPDPIPDPDRNPRIDAVTVSAYADETVTAKRLLEVTVETGDVLELPWGARVELEVQGHEADLQQYVVPGDDDSFSTRDETFSGRWFVTWGTLLAPTSDDPLAINTWTLMPGPRDSTDVPPYALATLYYVLRDDRQGVTWTHFQIRVTGGPPEAP
ncbi:MAG: hypothetical protein K1X88_27380 [Nannocystaceae bacterium]|nr:hypothetical protein [Nannocystaceae bacterium]